jgi:uncharacterized DUF497 family protein
VKIVWDEAKRQSNIARHGRDLANAELFDWTTALVVPGNTGPDGRARYRAVGWLLVTTVFSRQRDDLRH